MAQLKETTIQGNLHLKGEGVKIYVNDTEFQGGGGSGAGVQSDWKATTASEGAIKNKIPIENGTGEKSVAVATSEAKGRYSVAGGTNDSSLLQGFDSLVGSVDKPIAYGDMSLSFGAGTKSLTSGTVSLGANSIAGCKGYYWWSIDFTTKDSDGNITPTIQLSTKQKNALNWSKEIPTNLEWTVGDVISIVNKSKYTLCSTIKSVDTAKGIITVDSLPFTSAQTVIVPMFDDYSVICPSKPEKGEVDLGFGAFAIGLENKAVGSFSHVEGWNNLGAGDFSHAEGRDNTAGYASHAEGYNTQALGLYSHSEGDNTQALGTGSHSEGYGTIANGAQSHSEGYNTTASGFQAHSEGWGTKALGSQSHSEGDSTLAIGEQAHSEGLKTIAIGKNTHAEGSGTTLLSDIPIDLTIATNDEIISQWGTTKFSLAKGDNSHTEGLDNLAIGLQSHAEGRINKAIGKDSHSEGANTTASGEQSHSEGDSTIASGNQSHSQNRGTKAIGVDSHAEGYYTEARGDQSHAQGYKTIAVGNYQHVQGKFNDPLGDDYAFIIGGGTSSDRMNIHTLDWKGNAAFAGLISSKGEDYAEFFEWQDGNIDNEDRVGLIVTLDGEMIKPANSGDEVLGIISGTVAVLGGNYECEWNSKYLTDDFGRVIYDIVEEFSDEIVGKDEEGNPIIEKQSLGFFEHPRINPDYDPDQKYVNRTNRPEWDTVGMLGKLYVRDDGTCIPNFYATVGANGIATSSLEKTNMRVLSRVNDNVVRVLLK